MAREDMGRFEIAVYVSKDLIEKTEKALEAGDDDCLLLDMEKLVAVHLEHVGKTSKPDVFPDHVALPDSGADIVEVYAEGFS